MDMCKTCIDCGECFRDDMTDCKANGYYLYMSDIEYDSHVTTEDTNEGDVK